MATGAAHYRAAEELLAAANEREDGDYRFTPLGRRVLLAEAQVHATLAQAAAQIEPTIVRFGRGYGGDERVLTEWTEVVSA